MEKQKNKLISVLSFIFSTKNLDKRNFGIDFVKSIAALFVLSVHFLLNNGYYAIPMTEKNILVPTAFRWLFILGVPLFLISTGFLKRKTKFSGLHYVKITPVIVTTILVGVLTVLYKVYLLYEDFPLFIWLRSVWACEQPEYAWYVNMYLGLAMIMPFISYAWNAVESQRKKQVTIIIFAMVSSLPTQINRWPVMGTNLGIPGWWTSLYPVTYFLIGAYIGEYQPKIKKWITGPVLAVLIIYQAFKTYYTAHGDNFYTGVCAYYEDLITVMTGTLLFLLIYDINVKIKPVRAIFASISSVTLGLYLLSWTVDNKIYQYHNYIGTFKDGVKDMPGGYFRIVPLEFAVCYAGATVLNVITKLITGPVIKFAAKKDSKPENTGTPTENSEKETVSV